MTQRVWATLLWEPEEDLRKGGKGIRAKPWQRGQSSEGTSQADIGQGQATDMTWSDWINMNRCKQNKKQVAE